MWKKSISYLIYHSQNSLHSSQLPTWRLYRNRSSTACPTELMFMLSSQPLSVTPIFRSPVHPCSLPWFQRSRTCRPVFVQMPKRRVVYSRRLVYFSTPHQSMLNFSSIVVHLTMRPHKKVIPHLKTPLLPFWYFHVFNSIFLTTSSTFWRCITFEMLFSFLSVCLFYNLPWRDRKIRISSKSIKSPPQTHFRPQPFANHDKPL